VDGGTRQLFVGAFLFLIVLAVLAAVFLSVPADAPPTDTVAVEGVIVAVDSAGLGDVRSFELRTADGQVRTFGLAMLENGATFPPGHLLEHAATAEPVRVYWRTVEGVDQAIRIDDARPSAPAAS
jgi:hypothetical protein